MNSYCYDTCEHNIIPRRHWNDNEGGKSKSFSKAESGTNLKLTCLLGYKQMANTKEAMFNSHANNTPICPKLRKVL
jgi:hypothetical protein